MIKALFSVIWFVVLPIILGMLPMKFNKNEKNNILYDYLIGFFIKFSVLQLISIPMIFKYCSLTELLTVYCVILGIIALISIIINAKNLKACFLENLKTIKTLPKKTIIVILLIGFQLFMSFWYTHIDDDDSFYVATATEAVESNTLYEYAALEGYKYERFPIRYVLSPFPMYTAITSKIIDVHPAIIAHTVFPVVFISMSYMVYALIGEKLFNKDKNKVNLFLIIISILYIFGGYSIRSNFAFLLYRSWQGKAIIANIMIPMIGLQLINCVKNNDRSNWCILFITMFATCLLSEMGMVISAMGLMVLTLIFVIKDKKINYLIKSGLCCIPILIYTVIYLFMS